jgi:tellurite methyltransferase
MKEILSANIVRYRKAAKLTQEDLASRLGISFQAVSKWETGLTMPEIATLTLLAKELKVSVDKLLGYAALREDTTHYEAKYQNSDYYWGGAAIRKVSIS